MKNKHDPALLRASYLSNEILTRTHNSHEPFKGTVQRKLTGILSGMNRKLMICHCSDGYSFFNLKGLRSLKSKNVFSALTGTLF
jgi:hypothetical protein